MDGQPYILLDGQLFVQHHTSLNTILYLPINLIKSKLWMKNQNLKVALLL